MALLLLSYLCIASISAVIITPALPLIEQSYQLGSGQIESIMAIFLLGYVIGQLIYGPLCNRCGPIKALRLGLILNLCGVITCLSCTILQLPYSYLLVGRFITAIGAASGLPIAFLLINESYPHDKAQQILAYAKLTFTISIGIAVCLGGYVTQWLSWQACFWTLLIHGVLTLLMTSQLSFKKTQSTQLTFKQCILSMMRACKQLKLIRYSIVVGVPCAFSYLYGTCAPQYAQNELHLSPETYASWNLVNTLFMLLGSKLIAALTTKYTKARMLQIGFLCTTVSLTLLGCFLINHSDNSLFFFLCTALLFISTAMLYPSASALACHSVTDRASASSVMNFINMSAALITVSIVGHIHTSALKSLITVFSAYFLLAFIVSRPWQKNTSTVG